MPDRSVLSDYCSPAVLTVAVAQGSFVQTYTFPQIFDIKEDVKESFELWGNEGYVHAWVMGPVKKILAEVQGSMKKYPNIRPGQDFKGYQ